MKNVAVFFGGKAPEREISIITGVFVLNSIDKSKFNPIPVFIDGDGTFFTGERLFNLDFYKTIDRKLITECTLLAGENKVYTLKRGKLKNAVEIYAGINCIHGRYGEDGSLLGLATFCDIPLVSPGIFAESFSIDKDFTKLLLKALEIKQVEYLRLKRDYFFEKGELAVKYAGERLGYPLIVKPARLGSSIGIEKVNDAEQLFSALSRAFCYDDKVICEKYLQNAVDLNCAVYSVNGKVFVSRVDQTVTQNDLLTFEDKYGGGKLSDLTSQNQKIELSEQICLKVRNVCEKIYRRCDFSSIVRFDFLLCENVVYLNEINAVPGSLAYYFFCNKISEFSILLTELLQDAVNNRRKQKNLNSSFKSNVLSGDWSGIKK